MTWWSELAKRASEVTNVPCPRVIEWLDVTQFNFPVVEEIALLYCCVGLLDDGSGSARCPTHGIVGVFAKPGEWIVWPLT